MGLGYLGFVKISSGSGVAPSEQLLITGASLNRKVDPKVSQAVVGAGWHGAAQNLYYSNSQMAFEGGINFDLQYNSTVWGIFRNWLVETRVIPASILTSPSGYIQYLYQYSSSDNRSGVWLRSAGLRISPEALVSVTGDCVALKRAETVLVASNYAANLTTNQALSAGQLAAIGNPSPFDRNPIPGWNVQAAVVWPGAPPFWSNSSNQYGMVLQDCSFTTNNNTQIIRGATGDRSPVAVIQGTIGVTGEIALWRDGAIPDPYGDQANPSTFTASNASIQLYFAGSGSPAVSFNNILLNEDTYNVVGQNQPTTRTFQFMGFGDGVNPPCILSALA